MAALTLRLILSSLILVSISLQRSTKIGSTVPNCQMLCIMLRSCWDCQDFYIGKTKRRLHDRKTEHFKAITSTLHASAIADHVTSTGHKLKWDHFDILAKGQSHKYCKIKETNTNKGIETHPK